MNIPSQVLYDLSRHYLPKETTEYILRHNNTTDGQWDLVRRYEPNQDFLSCTSIILCIIYQFIWQLYRTFY